MKRHLFHKKKKKKKKKRIAGRKAPILRDSRFSAPASDLHAKNRQSEYQPTSLGESSSS